MAPPGAESASGAQGPHWHRSWRFFLEVGDGVGNIQGEVEQFQQARDQVGSVDNRLFIVVRPQTQRAVDGTGPNRNSSRLRSNTFAPAPGPISLGATPTR